MKPKLFGAAPAELVVFGYHQQDFPDKKTIWEISLWMYAILLHTINHKLSHKSNKVITQ
ncbi:MAG: hypothetical protein IKX20_02730 [Paludibacteraceae bacterium]|nr:hypothetical protein [Paludibacteraceae bacterium]